MSEASATQPRRASRPNERGRLLLAFAFLMLLAGLAFSRPLLAGTAHLLDVGGAPEASDLIFLLGGGIHSRPPKVVELYKQGFAPKVLLARVSDSEATKIGVMPNETDATVLMLTMLGVPDSAITVLSPPMGVSSTTAEAVELRSYLDANPASGVLVVTNPYHTRRARWQIRRQLRGVPVEVRMVAAEDPRFNASNWWQSEAGVLAYGEEYLKFVHNWVYGVTGRR